MGWRRRMPTILSLAGLGLVLAGFAYDVLFAGIPYQDPTPELSAAYARHAAIASAIGWSGVAAMVIAATWGMIRLVLRRRRP